MVRPINTLTRRIYRSIHSIRQLKHENQVCTLTYEVQKEAFRNLQISMLRDYKKTNQETNKLYFDFLLSAKIMFIARAISQQSSF